MRLIDKVFNMRNGSHSIHISELSHLPYESLLKVKLNGVGYDILNGVIPTPGLRQVQFISSFGLLVFDTAQNDSRVYILYKH